MPVVIDLISLGLLKGMFRTERGKTGAHQFPRLDSTFRHGTDRLGFRHKGQPTGELPHSAINPYSSKVSRQRKVDLVDVVSLGRRNRC